MPSNHLTLEQITAWREGRLQQEEISGAAGHLAECAQCRELTAPRDAGDRLADALDAQAHLAFEDLEALVANRISGDDLALAQRHLSDCQACAADLEDLRTFAASLRPAAAPRKRWLGAAIATGLASAALIAFLMTRQHPRVIAMVMDSGRPVSLDERGILQGLGELPTELRDDLTAALRRGTLPGSAGLGGLRRPPDTLLGDSDDAPGLTIAEPYGVVAASRRPTFRWNGGNGARFVVNIYTTDFQPVAASEELLGTSWQPATDLTAGQTYIWTVSATLAGRRITVPAAPQPEARFRILTDGEAAQMAVARGLHSDLALSVTAARLGMLDEAEKALARLPDSVEVIRLRAGLQQRRKNI